MEATKKSKVIILSFLVGAVAFGYLAYIGMSYSSQAHMDTIEAKIIERGGTLVAGSVVALPMDESPFERSGKGNTIFRIAYMKDGEQHTAWYRAKNQSSIIYEPEEWLFPE
jgi:hypothetical protein